MAENPGLGCGPFWAVDGPPPQAPLYTLLGAARVVPDADAGGIERWGNGVEIYPYPPDEAVLFDAASTGSDRIKAEGGVIPHPTYGALTVYLAETCSSFGIFGEGLSNEQAQDRFVGRARSSLAAVESAAIEREFLAGDVLGLNPHLADGGGTFPTVNVAQKVVEAFARLETEIADSGRRGMIHCSPAIATLAARDHIVCRDDRLGQLYTINGTIVVPGYGYRDTTVNPAGHSGSSATKEWVYATGPIDVRRGDPEVMPGTLSEALERGSNSLTYRVERLYLVSWDTTVQSAVLVDRAL